VIYKEVKSKKKKNIKELKAKQKIQNTGAKNHLLGDVSL